MAEEASLCPHSRRAERSADPLASHRRRPFGSKFWPLADEQSSDEEGDKGQEEGFEATCVPGHDSVAQDSIANNQHSKLSKVYSSTYVAGTKDSSIASPTSSITGSNRPVMKPWKGPLPAPRASPALTLGDIFNFNKAQSPGELHGRPHKVVSLVQEERTALSISSLPAGEQPPAKLKSEFQRKNSRDPGVSGRVVGLGTGPSLVGPISNNGKTACFTFSEGLGKFV